MYGLALFALLVMTGLNSVMLVVIGRQLGLTRGDLDALFEKLRAEAREAARRSDS